MFVTSSSRVPLGGFMQLQGASGIQPFQIHKVGLEAHNFIANVSFMAKKAGCRKPAHVSTCYCFQSTSRTSCCGKGYSLQSSKLEDLARHDETFNDIRALVLKLETLFIHTNIHRASCIYMGRPSSIGGRDVSRERFVRGPIVTVSILLSVKSTKMAVLSRVRYSD